MSILANSLSLDPPVNCGVLFRLDCCTRSFARWVGAWAFRRSPVAACPWSWVVVGSGAQGGLAAWGTDRFRAGQAVAGGGPQADAHRPAGVAESLGRVD